VGKYLDLIQSMGMAPGAVVRVSEPADRAVEEPVSVGVPAARAAWTRDAIPNNRAPLVPETIRAKIEAIESEARRKGWPPELLWNAGYWDCPRGLAAVLDTEDEIAEVTPEHILVLKTHRDLLRFNRRSS
jgi:hypothetical protein